MHLEILVEDLSGKRALGVLVPKIIGKGHTCRIISHKGIGRIPKNLSAEDASDQTLFGKLPKMLRAYGKSFNTAHAAVVVVCDLDDKHLDRLHRRLLKELNACDPKPETRFCMAIEEGEAWLLGDIPAIKKAYPMAKDSVLSAYVNDSICGTWECLADAIYNGGAAALDAKGAQTVGCEKSNWAKRITPHMNIKKNKSPSFAYFCEKLRELVH